MGTIVARKRKDGSTGYTAQIVIKRGGKIVHRQAQTFDRKAAAETWIKRRETELSEPGAIERAKNPGGTLSDAIDKYVETSIKAIGRTKAQVLRGIKEHEIADMDCAAITSADVVAFAEQLGKTRKPQTVSNYLSHLGSVFAIAKPAWGFLLDQKVMQDAIKVSSRLGLTGKSKKRARRPTMDELNRLMTHFEGLRAKRPDTNPMIYIVAFALFSTRRQEEITRIRWEDFEDENRRILVRDMKNPGAKIGNDIWCDLPDQAVQIIKAMPKGNRAEIFPYTTDAISAAFTRACQFLEIEDLHFHDLRHEGVSRLFEMGLNIPHVAAVSGHRSWSSLKGYTHIRQTGDKYKNWPWLAKVTTPLKPNKVDPQGPALPW